MKIPGLHLTSSTIALSIKAFAVLLATITIFHQDLTMLANEALKNEIMSYILVIPFLLTYLFYRKRKMLRATIAFETTNATRKPTYAHEIVGALLCLIAFLLYWHGSYTFHPLEYHMVSLPLFTAGLIIIIFNTKTLKVLVFPIVFILFLTPPPLEIIYATGTTLSNISSEAAYNFLKAIGLPVSLAYEYGTPIIILQKTEGLPLTFAVDIACAGIYSLIGFTIFAVFVAYIARGAEWKKAIVFLAGIPLIYSLNITRIIITVLIGNQYGMEAAMQAFHLLGGWVLIFIGSLILLTVVEKVFKIQLFATKQRPTHCNYCNQNSESRQHFCAACGKLLNPLSIKLSKQDLTKIFILVISAILIINIQVPAFALTQGPAEVTIQTLGGEQTITQVLPEVPSYTTEFLYRDKRFEEIAKQDASLAYAYIPTDKSKTTVWVTIEIANTLYVLHRWEACLITWPLAMGYQPKVTQLSLTDIQLLQNPPITARYFAFQDNKSNITQVVLYWYENALFNTGSSREQKHVKISLIAFAETPQDISLIGEQLLPFAKAIANYWQPIKTWSQIALLISQNGIVLIAVTVSFLATILSYRVIKNREEKRSNLKLYNKLAVQEEKIILQATHQASQQDKATANTIASHYKKLTEKPIELQPLLEKLNQAEKVGLTKSDITSQEDEPILTWKSQISFLEHKKLVKFNYLKSEEAAKTMPKPAKSKKESLKQVLRYKRNPSEIIGYTLMLFGAIALAVSIIYVSSILAFIGLGLTFWGALLLSVRPTKLVKANLLDSTVISSLYHMINDLKCRGNAIYLPPRYLKELKGGTIFIPYKEEIIIPPVEEVAKEKVFLNNLNGICLTPLGLGLANLYEKELGKDFATLNLNYLQNNLPKLFIEDLEIAEDLEINVEGDMIQVKITGSVYKNFCEEARKFSNICTSLGCPLCSSIAIALTRATGKPIIIKKTDLSKDNKTIEVYYQMIEE